MSTFATDEDFLAADEGDQCREIYALYGLVMYYAQVLEHGLVNLLYVLALDRGEITQTTQIDAFYDSAFRKTLGRLLKELPSTTVNAVDGDFDRQLQQGRDRRNFLAHHFFRVRAEMLATHPGRAAMRGELLAELEHFQTHEKRIDVVLFDIGAAHGFTPAAVQGEFDRLMQRLEGAEAGGRVIDDAPVT